MENDKQRIIDRFAMLRIRFKDENDLQIAVGRILDELGIIFEREKRLGDAGIIDFYCTDSMIGIECKTDGGPSMVIQQLTRYSYTPLIDSLILITSRFSHRRLGFKFGGKPLDVIHVGGMGI